MTFEMLIFGLYKALPVSLIVIYYVCENLFRFIYLSLFIYFNLLPIKAARPHEGFHNNNNIMFAQCVPNQCEHNRCAPNQRALNNFFCLRDLFQ